MSARIQSVSRAPAFSLCISAIVVIALAGCKQASQSSESSSAAQSSSSARSFPPAQAPPVASPPSQPAGVTVPFVGCKSDGQQGPQDAPGGQEMSLPITVEAAQQLSYYEAQIGVLAPRGWHCLGTYGSSGSELYVSPQPLTFAEVLSKTWKGFDGPAIEIVAIDGGTSGRFDAARIMARVFPDQRAFVDKVIKEGTEPAARFTFGPYPKDMLTYRSKQVVEYQTPANTQGLGTMSRLKKGADPIGGVAIVVGPPEEPNLVQLSVRLPADLAALAPVIIQQTERDIAVSTSGQ